MLDEKSLRIFEEHNLLSLRIRELECEEKSFTFEDDPLDLTIKKNYTDDDLIEVENKRFLLHGYGFSIEEAWQDFTEVFENAMYMIFDSGKPVSKSCQRFVDWAKKNVKGKGRDK